MQKTDKVSKSASEQENLSGILPYVVRGIPPEQQLNETGRDAMIRGRGCGGVCKGEP